MDIASSVASLTYSWAADKGNETLKAQTDLYPSDFDRLKGSLLPGKATTIHELATANKDFLGEYNVSDILLQSLEEAIADYEAVSASPRNKIAARTTESKKLIALFKEADDLLKDGITRLMPVIKKAFPDVVATFLANSKIVDAAGISAKEKAAKAAKAKTPAATPTP